MADEENTQTTTDTSSGVNQSTTDTEQSDEDKQKALEDAQKEEDEEEVETWTAHKGKIMQIKPYKLFSSISWDKSYEDPTGTGNVSMPYSSENIDSAFSPSDLKYIYQGVSCKVKIRRSCDEPFSATGIEEVATNEDMIFEREHTPTQEQKEEMETLLMETQAQQENTGDEIIGENKDDDIRYSRSSSDDGIYGFISEVSYNEDGAELEIKDYGYLLERDDLKLAFNAPHSVIFEEVIKSYGLIPDVDFTGLPNEVLDWTNVSNDGSTDDRSNAGDSEEFTDASPNVEMTAWCNDQSIPMKDCYKPEPTEAALKKIGKKGTNYAKCVEGCKDAKAVMTALRSAGWKYASYECNRYKDASESFKHINSLNCGDSSRLVKCCMDVCNIPCYIVQKHYHWSNVVKYNGKWVCADLCFHNEPTNALGA